MTKSRAGGTKVATRSGANATKHPQHKGKWLTAQRRKYWANLYLTGAQNKQRAESLVQKARTKKEIFGVSTLYGWVRKEQAGTLEDLQSQRGHLP